MSPVTLQSSVGDHDACHADRFVPLADEEVRILIEAQFEDESIREHLDPIA